MLVKKIIEQLEDYGYYGLDILSIVDLNFNKGAVKDRIGGVYFIVNDGEITYIGSAKDAALRMKFHKWDGKKIDYIILIVIKNRDYFLKLERLCIELFHPLLNKRRNKKVANAK